jgi:hypothetical protein
LKDYFTPDSLLHALPKLMPSDVRLPVGGRVFWQSGVIVLKDKTVLFWRTCGDWFIAIDKPTGTTFYAFEKKDTQPATEGYSSLVRRNPQLHKLCRENETWPPPT